MSAPLSGIYAIVNTTNGHQYIGSAVNMPYRWKRHINELKKNKHHSRHLQNAWNKYGESVFSFVVLMEVQDLNALVGIEQGFIDRCKPEYNVLSNSVLNHLGQKRTEETKQKIARSHIGIRPSEETRQKLSDTHKGTIISEVTKRKMSAATTGKYRGWSDKAVLQLSRDGTVLNIYESIMDAQRATGVNNQSIVRCCKGKRPTAGGFIWRYADTEQE